jgi:IQ and AAA domain-containing protein
MSKQRRDWVQWYRSTFGKIPDNLEKFYLKDQLETPLSPEEEEKAAAADEEKSKKKDKKDKKAKGKKKGGGDDGDEGGDKLLKIGPTEVVQKFDEFYGDYTNEWANRDERDNKEQKYDRQMAREEVMPIVQKDFQKDVDDMIKMELENLKLQLSGGKKKKGKGKKKKKGKGKKKKKANKLPGARLIKDMSEYEMLIELVKNGIVKKLPPANLKDFIGEFNYIHMMMEDLNERPREPSMALIRQLVTEYIIFPLGSALVRKRFPEHVRSFLFYGPAGTGKTLVVRAIASETRSVIFDLSPLSIESVFAADRKDSEKMVAMVMTAAKEYAPSLIYLDEADKIWPAKKKKKKGQKKVSKKDMKNPARIKTALNKWKPKWINDETRITIVGCTSEPHEGSKKEFKKFFDKSIYFPFPDYTTRRLMWKVFIENAGGKLKADF